MLKKRTYFFFFMLLCCFSFKNTAAQFPQLHFETLTTGNGLSSNTISCLYQDKKGFLWIGTPNGLNRYDGNIFQTFYNEEGNKNSLSGNSIVDILEDESGIFWIATRDGGLTRYDPAQTKDKQFTQIKHNPADSTSLPSDRMTAICDYNDAYLLLSSENMQLGFLNKKTLHIGYFDFNAVQPLPPPIDLNNLKKRSANNVWIHHIEADEKYIYFTLLTPDWVYALEKKTNTIYEIHSDHKTLSIPDFLVQGDSVWMATWNKGLYYEKNLIAGNVHDSTLQIQTPFPAVEVKQIENWNATLLLIATRDAGLYFFDKKTFSYQAVLHNKADKTSIASNKINCLLKDRNNTWWIGTGEGLCKYNPVEWQFAAAEIQTDDAQELTHYSVYETEKETLKLCTSNGVYTQNAAGDFMLKEFYYKNTKLQPTEIYKLPDGKYVLNTENCTFWYVPGTEKIELLVPDRYIALSNHTFYKDDPFVRGSYQVRFTETDTIDGHAFLLFGTMGWGLGIYDVTDDIYYDLIRLDDEKSIKNNLVRVLFKDKEKKIWVGTAEGLYTWNKSVPPESDFQKFLQDETDSTSISGNAITGMYQDAAGIYWITTNNGLNAFDGKQFAHYKPAFANSRNMYRLYADKNENLWIAVQGGFEVFNISTKTFRHVNVPLDDWALKYPAQILQSKNGEWVYGAGNNLISFRPDSYYFESAFPEIYLTGFSVFDEELFQTSAFSDLQFKHNNNFFTITFSSLQLSQPSTVKYEYWLKGLNEEWVEIGSTGKIVFTSLPPGNYELFAKVTNPQGGWSEAKELVAFAVSAPYWQQWWFFVLCAVVLGLAVYAFIKFREKQFLQMQTMRNKIANDLHDDVGSALSTINLYSEVAKMKTEEKNVELKNILDKISNTSIEMQENMTHIVWSLQPRNDTFEQMILRLKRYAVENLQAKDISITFQADEKLHELKLPPEKRKELFLIYKEVLHNILKYANCNTVHINFTKTKQSLQMQITDNGKGFNTQEKFAGNGLHTMQERAQALRGKLTLISKPGEGTSVVLLVPL